MRPVSLGSLAATGGLVGGPFGSSLVGRDYAPYGVPVIRGTNLGHGRMIDGEFVYVSDEKVARDLARNVAVAGDLVFTQRGTLGQVAIIPEEGHDRYVVSQSQMRLRVDIDTSASYVYYACSAGDFIKQVRDNAISTGVPHINLGILSRLQIPIRALPEQCAIAEMLGALDDKIAANVKVAGLTDLVIAVMHKHAIRHPASAPQPLLDFFEVDFGEAFKGTNFSEPGRGRALIRIRDLKTFTSQAWTTETRPREILIQPGDVVVGMDAEFRPTAWLGSPGLLNQRVCRVRSERASAPFVREAMKAPLAAIEASKSGTTVIHLNKSDLERAVVRIPPSDALRTFARATRGLFETGIVLAVENRSLSALRDALLPHLMSGRLRVRDAEKIVSDRV